MRTLNRQRRVTNPALDLYFYFIDLDDRSAHGFANKWDQISQHPFDATKYTRILYCTAVNLHAKNITFDLRGDILSHIRNHQDAWLTPALEKIETFNSQYLALSLWSLAVLDSYYREDSLTSFYKKLRDQVDLSEITDYRDLKQIRDADLWFTGHSNIPDPERPPRKKPALILEHAVRDAFHKVGFDVHGSSIPLRKILKQAIDFPVIDRKHDKEFWAEVDGPGHFLNFKDAMAPEQLIYNVHTYFRSALERRLAPQKSIILRIDAITSIKIQQLLNDDTKSNRSKMNKTCRKISDTAHEAGYEIHRTTGDGKTIEVVPMVAHDRNAKPIMML